MKTDFLMITALPEERDALLAQLPGFKPHPQTRDDARIYFTAEVLAQGHDATYHVTVLSLPGMGRVNAATATNDGILRWHPEYVVFVGIAGGFAQQSVDLGDVLISNQLLDYELQKLRPEAVEVRPSYPPISNRLLQAALNFFDKTWPERIKATRPAAGTPKVTFGPVATGDKVINDPLAIQRLLALSPKLIGVEMEAGGAATASHQGETNFFMIRGVSDLADGRKDSTEVGKWRPYACDVAAAYTIALVQSGLLAPPGPRSLQTNYELISDTVKSTGRALRMFDEIVDQVESVITGSDTPYTPREHRHRYEGGGIELVDKRLGQPVKTITGQDLQKLPTGQLTYINTLERSMENHLLIWNEVYPQLALMIDPIAKARVNQQLKGMVASMKDDLEGILSFLETCGLHLDDHYLNFRHLIKTHGRAPTGGMCPS